MISRLNLTALTVICLLLGGLGAAGVQAQEELLPKLALSYDLLEAGKLKEAKRIYLEILDRHPDHPLVLNNLAYIQVREGDLAAARVSLERALMRAKGYRIKVNKVCAVDGICLAFRPGGPPYGDQDLEPLVLLNLELVKNELAKRQLR